MKETVLQQHSGSRRGNANCVRSNRGSASRGNASRSGFTLIEVLIVIVIISILAALLFPAFQRARENGRQATCQSNLKQIYLATMQYKNDEREFPASLAVLLPSDTSNKKVLANTTGADKIEGANGSLVDDSCTGSSKTDTCSNPVGTGTLAMSLLMCPNDDKDDALRSSYGDISTGLSGEYANESDDENEQYFQSRYLWNYWGYDEKGVAYINADRVNSEIGSDTDKMKVLLDPARQFDVRSNRVKNSLSNRFAPANTVITHCIFHRTQTANSLNEADDLYTNRDNDKGARDIVLRLDGTTKPLDVTAFNTGTPSKWQTQDFD
jgi:prepilin-type N-terminal cleavage/methylation domain-containing protein